MFPPLRVSVGYACIGLGPAPGGIRLVCGIKIENMGGRNGSKGGGLSGGVFLGFTRWGVVAGGGGGGQRNSPKLLLSFSYKTLKFHLSETVAWEINSEDEFRTTLLRREGSGAAGRERKKRREERRKKVLHGNGNFLRENFPCPTSRADLEGEREIQCQRRAESPRAPPGLSAKSNIKSHRTF